MYSYLFICRLARLRHDFIILLFFFSFDFIKMTIEEEQNEPMLNHDDLAEQIGHMEPLAVGGMCIHLPGRL